MKTLRPDCLDGPLPGLAAPRGLRPQRRQPACALPGRAGGQLTLRRPVAGLTLLGTALLALAPVSDARACSPPRLPPAYVGFGATVPAEGATGFPLDASV